MDSRSSRSVLLLLLLNLASLMLKCYSSSQANMKTYIVYTGNTKNSNESAVLLYKNMLTQVAESKSVQKSIIHYYKRSFSGFAAKLTEKEAGRMARLDGVVSVFPNDKKQLLTTKSWDFLGFPQHVKREYSEHDVIIGVIDTGIWPESDSFNDKGFGPPPTKWKGSCQSFDFPCNNKLIGARYYRLDDNDDDDDNKEMYSARDFQGHGTHVASTAAGNPISQASMVGLGKGTSRGGATSARIAVYKVCWVKSGCTATNILAAFDDAIADGVDILSVSLQGPIANDNLRDPLSIGAFHAIKNGILTVYAAGNSGPYPTSLQNHSPWSIVVAAGTINRKYVTRVKLGDNTTYEGISINTLDLSGSIIYGGDVPNKKAGFKGKQSKLCQNNTLDDKLVKGKIILCDVHSTEVGKEALRAGAIGVLMQGDTMRDCAHTYPLPTCYLQSNDADDIRKYIHSTSFPTATIYKTNELENDLAPMVASFSSRGPNNVVSEILKLDLIAPGVDIIASWSPISPPSDIKGDQRKVEFNILSGTSMACPHVSGAAGYIKAFHPKWSPAAIRSALMTTAKKLSPIDNPDAEFGYGAGLIDPVKALNPGLIYDADESDYIRFLCGQGYDRKTILLITKDDKSCSNTTHTSARDLNYPSFALKAPRPKHYLSGVFHRTVTNVGVPKSTYRASVTAPEGLNITVKPSVLSFNSLGEKMTYVLTIDGATKEPIGSASLIWDDGVYQVRSPIVVFDARSEKGKGTHLYCINYMYIVILNLLFLFYY